MSDQQPAFRHRDEHDAVPDLNSEVTPSPRGEEHLAPTVDPERAALVDPENDSVRQQVGTDGISRFPAKRGCQLLVTNPPRLVHDGITQDDLTVDIDCSD